MNLLQSKKNWCFLLTVLLLLCLWIVPGLCKPAADINAEGSYRSDELSEGEDSLVAEARALARAKQNAVEEAGSYIRSNTKVQNNAVVEDVIEISAASVIKVKILERKRIPLEKTVYEYWCKILANLSTEEVELMARDIQEKSLRSDYKNLQQEYLKNQQLDEELRKQFRVTQSTEEGNQLKQQIIANNKKFKAIQLFDDGYIAFLHKQYDASMTLMSKVIELVPDYADAYNYRGNAYSGKGQYEKALIEFNKALELRPDYATAYYNRGTVFAKKGDSKQAMQDLSKAITLDSQDYSALNNRGNIYASKDQQNEAIADFTQAIQANSKYAPAYLNRGLAYYNKSQYLQALEDCNKAIEYDGRLSNAYYNKALVLEQLEKKEDAIDTYIKFIQYATPEQASYVLEAKKRIGEINKKLN